MKIYLPFLFMIILLFFSSCSSDKHTRTENGSIQLPKVKNVYHLPAEFTEISGIAFVDTSTIALIEDENGTVAFYDILQRKITDKKNFAGKGDYEDLCVTEKDLYVVQSNGKLFHIKNFRSGFTDVTKIETPFKSKNNLEGIAYEKAKNRLLISPKDEGLNTGKKKVKVVYALSLLTHKLDTVPAFTLDIKQIEDHFKGDDLEELSKKFLKAIGNENMNKVFRTSALAVHPKTQEIFMLSSLNNMIAVLTPAGRLKKIMLLKGLEFTKPEGIAFTGDGRLFVSNEGTKTKSGNILELTYEN